MPLTNFAKDNLISQGLSFLTECNAIDISDKFPEKDYWLLNYFLNSNIGGIDTKNQKKFAIIFLRRSQAAFIEYDYAITQLKKYIQNK